MGPFKIGLYEKVFKVCLCTALFIGDPDAFCNSNEVSVYIGGRSLWHSWSVEAGKSTLKQLKNSIFGQNSNKVCTVRGCCVQELGVSSSLELFLQTYIKQTGYLSGILQASIPWVDASRIFVGKVRKILFKRLLVKGYNMFPGRTECIVCLIWGELSALEHKCYCRDAVSLAGVSSKVLSLLCLCDNLCRC